MRVFSGASAAGMSAALNLSRIRLVAHGMRHIVRVCRHRGDLSPASLYEFGLTTLLDGLAARIKAATPFAPVA
ncbi:hypothetical protein ACFOZ0_20820 [Streptomyces yaanensis]|uniref:Uncharacterized protein n=1 Tax=Streptomyces yaanensis TaxID=1142239 RepID=A0ABV7SHD7_9ACTN|nr:hypothetical protein [Streptomyces sp. CGMCC 4.7035]WNB97713.1 hypothetical protein Q2K21_06280 [Streptomyces sp. CGMCC 4.7035]